ncbi:hypothetical protein [Hymenobacter cellulosilyticus]|uniref:Uncharacterized protein n=1 Tax=Hymenobacter cellulosilyticus TaxID=2932248 RepID=A0A8T9Q6W7_9BACT|nr:hypothetical protein [Hymenobacter cellulosilyticus]UOQ72151.1 hypothetical protein MUN79_26910 [Hymenobacter cellulosilyticus]
MRYGAISTELKISDGTRQVKGHIHLVGINQLIEKLTQQLGRSRAELGIPGL